MSNKTADLNVQISQLKILLLQEKKTSTALLTRVKNNLRHHVQSNEVFERNTLLLSSIKESKIRLLIEKEQSQKNAYFAKHDSLTGLLNRDEFEIQLKQLALDQKVTQTNNAVLFLDLDQFKIINDTAGHYAGDKMLIQIASILNNNIRESDALARLGGDEFGIILHKCSGDQVKNKANKIIETIEKFRFKWENNVFSVGVSIGIVLVNNEIISHIETLKNADIACYAAKNSGRNRYHIYDKHAKNFEQYDGEVRWVPKIIEALEKDTFCIFAQQIKPTDVTKSHLNYELLIRMMGKNNEFILPGAFLPAAERFNLITKIDYWMVNASFDWIKNNEHNFSDQTHFSINLSGQSMGDESFLNDIVNKLKKGDILGTKIHFEVTETMAISNLSIAQKFIKQVQQLGCGFSLDDFGSGLSSFNYLKNLNINTLKIDGAFIRNIMDDKIDEAFVKSINEIGHLMGMETIAEYVENEQIAEKLTSIGVDYLQGHAFSKAIPIDEIIK